MRKANIFILFLAGSLLIIGALSLHASNGRPADEAGRRYRSQLVAELDLTDLCLFTEARYTRHLAMADNHAAFQDHPVALEHFPSGALTKAPALPQRNHDTAH